MSFGQFTWFSDCAGRRAPMLVRERSVRRAPPPQSRATGLPRRAPPSMGGCPQATSQPKAGREDRKSTRLNSSHGSISYAVFCLKKKKKTKNHLSLEKKKKKITN